MTDRQKQAFIKCGIPPEEWDEILATDKEIDRGAKLFELDPELEKGAKKARQADRKPVERKPREKKQDKDKQVLINALFSAVLPMCDTYEIVNGEREFLFTYNGKKYKVVLSAPRT